MKPMMRLYIVCSIILLVIFKIQAQVVVDPLLTDAFANSSMPQQVVVTFKGNSAPTLTQISLLKQTGILKGFTFKSIPIAGVVATKTQIDALAKNPQVRSLYLNSKLEYHNHNATAITGVDKVRTDANFIKRNGGMPLSGKGIRVFVNDSGVDGTHEDIKYPTHLIQNVLGSTNPHAYDALLPIIYLEDIPNSDNNSGHGTHVSGIVGATGSRSAGKYEGVAPGADLIGYGSGAVLLVLDALGGFDYMLANQYRYKIRVMNNSWGSSGSFNPDNPVNVASKIAFDRGITICWSASNSGPYEWTLNPYAAPWVITVASSDVYGKLVESSSRGLQDDEFTFHDDQGKLWKYENKPTITAPGDGIISTRTVSPLVFLEEDATIEPAYLPFYAKMSGTSMASPHVAGIVALILEANPGLSPLEVKHIIENTATNLPDFEEWEVGAGFVNAYAAVDLALRSSNYGTTLNIKRKFNSRALFDIKRTPFVVDFNPMPELSSDNNEFVFTVPPGLTALEAISNVHGIEGETGNVVDLGLIAPDGTEYHSNIYVAFTLYHEKRWCC